MFDAISEMHRRLDYINSLKDKYWVERLYIEFDNIIKQHRIKLQPPVIATSNTLQTLGQWEPVTRTIFISQHLIKNHSWEVVLGILKHEMAHQIVSEILLSSGGHDKAFQSACDMLLVPKHFRKANIALDEKVLHWKNQTSSDLESAIFRKIEKLLSLAESQNEHEAYLAMEKAHELLAQYNINKTELNVNNNYVNLTIPLFTRRIEKPIKIICGILSQHYFVRVIYSHLYDASKLDTFETVNVLGTRENVLIAEYVFFFLQEKITHLWNAYKKNNLIGQKLRLSYQIGLLSGFSSKLDKHSEVVNKNNYNNSTKHLIKTQDAELQKYVSQEYPRLVSTTMSKNNVNADVYNHGREHGKNIVIHKGVGNSNAKPLLLS